MNNICEWSSEPWKGDIVYLVLREFYNFISPYKKYKAYKVEFLNFLNALYSSKAILKREFYNFYHLATTFKLSNRGVSLFGMVKILFEKSLISM